MGYCFVKTLMGAPVGRHMCSSSTVVRLKRPLKKTMLIWATGGDISINYHILDSGRERRWDVRLLIGTMRPSFFKIFLELECFAEQSKIDQIERLQFITKMM